jgi:hypothetical protein
MRWWSRHSGHTLWRMGCRCSGDQDETIEAYGDGSWPAALRGDGLILKQKCSYGTEVGERHLEA